MFSLSLYDHLARDVITLDEAVELLRVELLARRFPRPDASPLEAGFAASPSTAQGPASA